MNEEAAVQNEYILSRSTVRNFCRLSHSSLDALAKELGLAASAEELAPLQRQFGYRERRAPMVGELFFADALLSHRALSADAFRIGALHFESPDDGRIWQDICQKRTELKEERFYPSIASLMGLCTRYLDRLGFLTLQRGLSCAETAFLEAFSQNAALTLALNGDCVAFAPEEKPTQDNFTQILRFAPSEGEELTLAAAEFLKKASAYPLLPVALCQNEGLLAHLVALDCGVVTDASLLPYFCTQRGIRSVLEAKESCVLLFGREQDVAALLQEFDGLRLIGQKVENNLFTVKNGADTLICCEHAFLKRLLVAQPCELFVPAACTPFENEIKMAENDAYLLCGTQASHGAEGAVSALFCKAALGGADPESARLCAVLRTPPLDSDEKKGAVLRLVLGLHRATAELCLPVVSHKLITDHTCDKSTLSLFLLAEKHAEAPEFDPCVLQKAQNEGDFAAVRKILFENS